MKVGGFILLQDVSSFLPFTFKTSRSSTNDGVIDKLVLKNNVTNVKKHG